MGNIYSHALSGLCGAYLATAISKIVVPNLLISSIFFINRTIYHYIRGLLLINKVSMTFRDLPLQKPAVLRNIKALCPGMYAELTKQCMINRLIYEK